jgi:predicted O-methyltransferase YrrM
MLLFAKTILILPLLDRLSDCKVKILNNTGSGIASLSLKFLRHRIFSGHRNGHGIHSPYLYDLVRNVIFNKAATVVPEEILLWHRNLANSKVYLDIHDHGAGSRVNKAKRRKVSSLVKHASITSRQGALLYRLCHWYRPRLILEFGSGLGISTAYLTAGSPDAQTATIEGSPEKHAYAVDHFPERLSSRVEFVQGGFDDHFEMMYNRAGERTVIFIDGDHRYRPTVDKVRAFLNKELAETMIILDDIYWSAEMEKAWEVCLNDERVDLSLDLFHLGILIRRPDIARQHLRIKL